MLRLLLITMIISITGCSGKPIVEKQKRKKTPYGGNCNGDFSLRGNYCVRKTDQCPKNLILEDESCKQTPCNNNLYFDGNYCITPPETALRANSRKQKQPLTQIEPFSSLCLKADWTDEQKITNLGIAYLGLKSKNLLTSDNFSLAADPTTCALAKSYIFDNSTYRIDFPFKGLTDLTPLQAFEYATNITQLYIEVARGTIMSCPVTNKEICIFIPFLSPAQRL